MGGRGGPPSEHTHSQSLVDKLPPDPGREGEHEQGALSDGPHHLVLVTATVHLCAHLKQGELT